jgi:class 3 adenylate cyclase/tetratricopeptide (TPR) repeat protein
VTESRKTVTIVFTDVTGSTALGEQTDPEAMRRIMERYFEEMRSVLEKHGGTVEKFIGDAVMAVFGIPQVHEDDALRAVRAAAEMRERLAALNEEFERERGIRIAVRTGVNTGEVVAGDPVEGQAFATGDAVNVAARLEQAAEPGEILLGPVTHQLVKAAVRAEPVEALDLKGKAQAVEAWQLREVLPDAPAFTRRIDAPFVGRAEELARLREAFGTAGSSETCQLITVVGAPGIGKSRLVRELVTSVGDDAGVVVGRCLSYGEGITYWPLAEIVRQAAGAETREGLTALLEGDADAGLATERILSAIGVTDEPARTEEIFWATRILLERLAREKPLIVVVDDIHWAEPTFLDLVEYLAGFAKGRVLVICTARPELFESRPDWTRGGTLELEALPDTQAEDLIDALLADSQIKANVLEQIKQRAEGNPLFVEQMLALAAESGADEIAVPATIQALLVARLDHLPSEQRAVLVRAAVEGRLFHRGAVSALLPEDDRDGLPGRLLTLARKAFVRPDESLFPGDEAFRFAHALVRDAAYEATTKEVRADLHERFVAWLEENAGERLSELEEILGYHLEQSWRYRKSLGEDAGDLARRAGERLAAAGLRALDRGDVTAAVKLIRRARELLARNETRFLELAAPLAAALLETGEPAEGAKVLADAEAEARQGANKRLTTLLRLHRLGFEVALDPEVDVEKILEEARAAVDEFGPDDDAILAAAWERIQDGEWVRGRLRAAKAAAERVLTHAERLGDIRTQAEAETLIGASGFFGSEPIDGCIAAAQSSIDWAKAHGALAHEAMAMYALGALTIEQGRVVEGRDVRDRGWAILEELGMRLTKAGSQGSSGDQIGIRALELERLLERLRLSYEVLEAAGETGTLSTVAHNLAMALYDAGEYEDAEHFSNVSEQLGAVEDVVTQVGWRAARAKALAQRGRVAEAEKLAREAVTRALATEYWESTAEAYLSLGEVLRLASRPEDAREAIESALSVTEQKGFTLSADAIRGKLAELQSSGSPSQ